VENAVNYALRRLATSRPANPVKFLADALLEYGAKYGGQRQQKAEDGGAEAEAEVEGAAEGEDEGLSAEAEQEKMARLAGGRKRRDVVFAEAVTADASFVAPVHPKSDEQKAQISAVAGKSILFSGLDSEQMQIIVDAMFEIAFEPGSTIIKQGDEGDNFYIIADGICDIFVNAAKSEANPTGKVLQVKEGGSFGELALLYDAPRAATVVAVSPTRCWAIDRMTFKQVMISTTTKKRDLYEHFLAAVPIFSSLSTAELHSLSDALHPRKFAEGEVIITEGSTDIDLFYIVEGGECKATKEGLAKEVCARLGPGAIFGELSLLNNQVSLWRD
jgi:cAMP-dependent protein kinase regulator